MSFLLGHGGGGGGHRGHGRHRGGYADEVFVDPWLDVDDLDPDETICKRCTIAGLLPPEWDGARGYRLGDRVGLGSRFFYATRDIAAPALALLGGGPRPGSSSAWQELSLTTITGRDMLGMLDMTTVTRNLNAVKPVTVEIARTMLRGGHEAIAGAITGAKQPWYKPDLPGDTERQNVSAHLAWHEAHIGQLPTAPNTIYDAADDLKKWVIAAYVDANAVEEGAAYIGASWDKMWSEIQTQLRAIPAAIVKAAGGIAAGLLGIPTWAFWVGGALTVGLLGVVVWKLANSGAGQAAIRGYTGGLVGRRG